MGRLVHLLTSDDPDKHYQILSVARKYFGTGGSKRVSYTLPPIIFQAFQLAKTFYAIKDKVSKKKPKRVQNGSSFDTKIIIGMQLI